MWGIIFFSVGIVGLFGYFSLLAWETKSGVRAFSAYREKLDRFATRTYRAMVFGEIPHIYRHNAVLFVRRSIHRFVIMLIGLLRSLEKPLARMSARMRHAQNMRAGNRSAPSPFLKDMAPKESNSQNEKV